MDTPLKPYIYTIYTRVGREEYISEQLDKFVADGVITDKYIPMRVLARKIKGNWIRHTERLFPGYLFVETYDPEKFCLWFKRIQGMLTILTDGQDNFYRLPDEEVKYLSQIGASRNDHTFDLSQVEIDDTKPGLRPGDRVNVVSGDLMGFKGDIVRYDPHHRKAYIRTTMFGGSEVGVGIELLSQQSPG